MDEILFLFPALTSFQFFEELYDECESQIELQMPNELRPICRSVSSSSVQFCGHQMLDRLRRELSRSDRIRYVVVAPTDHLKLSKEVAKLSHKMNFHPVSITQPFYCWPRTKTKSAKYHCPKPTTVLSDSDTGTHRLGESAASQLKLDGVQPPVNCLIIPGTRRRIDSLRRIKGFKTGLESSLGFVPNYVRCGEGKWQRALAYEEVTKIIEKAKDNSIDLLHGRRKIDVIFAANDDMALGARDAVVAAMKSQATASLVSGVLIYGFDATSEARRLIDMEDHYFKGTVSQDKKQMATRLVEVIKSHRQANTLLVGGDERIPVTVLTSPILSFEELISLPEFYPARVPLLDKESKHWMPLDGNFPSKKPGLGSLKKYVERAHHTEINQENTLLGRIDHFVYRRVEGVCWVFLPTWEHWKRKKQFGKNGARNAGIKAPHFVQKRRTKSNSELESDGE